LSCIFDGATVYHAASFPRDPELPFARALPVQREHDGDPRRSSSGRARSQAGR
jgi:hypothetical protein